MSPSSPVSVVTLPSNRTLLVGVKQFSFVVVGIKFVFLPGCNVEELMKESSIVIKTSIIVSCKFSDELKFSLFDMWSLSKLIIRVTLLTNFKITCMLPQFKLITHSALVAGLFYHKEMFNKFLIQLKMSMRIFCMQAYKPPKRFLWICISFSLYKSFLLIQCIIYYMKHRWPVNYLTKHNNELKSSSILHRLV